MEKWKDIDGYEELYQVSDLGRIKRKPFVRKDGAKFKEKILKNNRNSSYELICLCKDNKKKTLTVHRLVAKAFIPNHENKPQVNHIDGNKFNNHSGNLEWVTVSENNKHAFDTGLKKPKLGEEHDNTKITKEIVIFIRENYKFRDKEFSTAALGRKFGLSQQHVSDIVNNRRWTHV